MIGETCGLAATQKAVLDCGVPAKQKATSP
jgi:hypothetical protein